MTDQIREALERLVAADKFIGEAGPEYQQARDAARAALAQPEPEMPTDDQLIEEAITVRLAFQPQDEAEEVYLPFDAEEPLNDVLVDFARAVLARWGRPASAPAGDHALRDAALLALTTLEGWANYDEWLWPDSALEQAKRNTTEAVASLEAALSHPATPPTPAAREVAELVAALSSRDRWMQLTDAQVDRAADLLEQFSATPPTPATGEVGELVEWLERQATKWRAIDGDAGLTRSLVAEHFTRAAALLEQFSAAQAPQPVAVGERLPEPRDCAPWPDEPDASAWCWVGSDVDGGWSWEQRSAGCLAAFPDDFTHWLPAHALAIPTTSHAGQEGA